MSSFINKLYVCVLMMSVVVYPEHSKNKALQGLTSNNHKAATFQKARPGLQAWIDRFQDLPKNRQGADPAIHSGFLGSQEDRWTEFKDVHDEYLQKKTMGCLSRDSNWQVANTGAIKLDDSHYNLNDDSTKRFVPFAQKYVAQPGEKFIIRGDLHGDIFSLLEQLKDMRSQGMIDDNFKLQDGIKMIFLGDYVDRGQYGLEVLYTMMRLANANPDGVMAVRGNHEDIDLQSYYGFKDEIEAKFGGDVDQKHQRIARMNDLLPVVLYLGDKSGRYFQCCHGGMEQGYDPKPLLTGDQKFHLLGNLHRKSAATRMIDHPDVENRVKRSMESLLPDLQDNFQASRASGGGRANGFMWSDFSVNDTVALVYKNRRGFVYGKDATQAVLQDQSDEKAQVVGVMRAHQHSADPESFMMQKLINNDGVCQLWKPDTKDTERIVQEGDVVMFNVGPDTVYGAGVGFEDDTSVELEQTEHGDWKMKARKHYPFKSRD